MVTAVSITEIKAAINKARTKFEDAQQTDDDNRVLQDRIRQANSDVSNREDDVTRAEMVKAQAEDKLSPPPTKTVSGDGKKGGTKQVVDEREKDKLQAKVRAAQVDIDRAKNAVEEARSYAEGLVAEDLDSAGLTGEQQDALSDLNDLVDRLKGMTEDSQTNLEGEEFQNQLRQALEDTERLAEELPNADNASLETKWKNIYEGLAAVEERFTAATTPDPYEIAPGDEGNNYNQFFTNYEQGLDTIISRLPPDSEAMDALLLAKRNISQTRKLYLGGLEEDQALLRDIMDNVNGIINNMDRDRDLGDSLTTLVIQSQHLSRVMGKGGSGYESIVGFTFYTIEENGRNVRNHLEDIGQLSHVTAIDNIRDEYGDIIAGLTDPERLADPDHDRKSMTLTDYRKLTNFTDRLGELSDMVDSGAAMSEPERFETELLELLGESRDLLDNTLDKYIYRPAVDNNTSSSSNNTTTRNTSNGTATTGAAGTRATSRGTR